MIWRTEVAEDLANALLDAAQISRETGKPCYITRLGQAHVATDHVDDDYTLFRVDPPTEEPDQVKNVA